MIALTRREARVTVARILRQAAWPTGHEPAVTAAVLAAEGLGLPALASLDHDWPAIAGSDPQRLQAADGAVDCGGMHALVALPFIVDLLVERLARDDRASVRVIGAARPDLLAAIQAFGPRHGAAFGVDGTAVSAVRADAPARALHGDFAVDAALWQRLCTRAEAYLVPESEISRRHAGSSLSADGSDAGDAG